MRLGHRRREKGDNLGNKYPSLPRSLPSATRLFTLMVTFPHAAFKTGPKDGAGGERHCLVVERPTGRTRTGGWPTILQPKYRSSIRDGQGCWPFFTAAAAAAPLQERKYRTTSSTLC